MSKRLICLCLTLVIILSVSMSVSVSADETTLKIRDIYIPETMIVNPPAVVQNIDTPEKLSGLTGEVRPQLAWMTLDATGAVQLGQSAASLSDALKACANKVIPVLRICDLATAEIVSAAVKDIYYDVILASDQEEVILKLYNDALPYCRLAYITSGNDPKAMAQKALSCYANIVVLPTCDRQTAEYLQQRFLSVMLKPADITDDLAVRAAVDCGANQIVLDQYQVAYDMYTSVQRISYVRQAFIVGHRTMVSAAPENTVEGLHEAFKNGADAVEIDIRRTTDDRIVCFHNNYLKGSTTVEAEEPERYINTYSYAELQEFTLNPKGEYTNCKIPTLDAMLEAIKQYPGKILVIEIKESKEIASFVNELIERYDAADQCVFIAFGKNQLNLHRTEMPSIGGSLLDSGYEVNGSTLGQVDRAMQLLSGTSGAYSPSKTINPETVVQLNCRGISCNLWTAYNLTQMMDIVRSGAQFITTDMVEEESWVRMSFNRMSADEIFGAMDELSDATSPDNAPSAFPWIIVATVLLGLTVLVIGATMTLAIIKRKRK